MTPPSKLTCNNGQANLGGSSDEYVETRSNKPEHCKLYLFSESRKCKPVYGGPLSPAGLGTENGFWKFDRFQQQVCIMSGNKEAILSVAKGKISCGLLRTTSKKI